MLIANQFTGKVIHCVRVCPRIAKLIERKKGIRLDLACGESKQGKDWVGIDKRKFPCVDIVHDLETFPWPLPDSCVRTCVASHYLEHVKPWVFMDLMAELHRVCQDGAQVFVSGPYGAEYRWCQDPTHCRPIVEATFLYFDDRHPLWQVYKPPVWTLEHWELFPVGTGRDFNAILRCVKPNGKPGPDPRSK